MATSSPDATVLQALQSLYQDPDAAAKKRANEWLSEFQHTQEAWQTCHNLLTAQETPVEGRLFGAQTIRAKILWDLGQLPREALTPLRDSLLQSITLLTSPSAPTGARAILVQVCLAVSDLALQMPEWDNVVGSMIERFGKEESTVNVMLQFLKCLVEEAGNPRVPMTFEGAQDRTTAMMATGASQVLDVLTMYIQAQGVTPSIQNAVFETLRAWLQGGELMASRVAQSPLFAAAFDALASDELFDSAVDVLCDLIHETQEIEDNLPVIQMIVPRVVALRSGLQEHNDDPDRIRGYCRLFTEAGETYRTLILSHLDDFFPIVEAIAACAAYPDLDIVPITFNFWYKLAQAIGKQPEAGGVHAPLLELYANLQGAIITHLHFPADASTQTAAERDEFRSFRHQMGDTLKDCCYVLGASVCLRRSYDMVVSALAKGQAFSWQEIEAPLFSMRSMGAEVDADDDSVLPHIMDLIPKLPQRPKIQYAAILVISRYTHWIDKHPQNLAFQLEYISAGFHIQDEDVSAAAAQAMKHLCEDCHQHLINFLPQLHAFVTTVADKLPQEDRIEVCEAIGYVIQGMKSDEAAPALQQFCEPAIQKIQAIATAPQQGTPQQMEDACDALDQLDAYLGVIKTLTPFPQACYATCAALYQVLDALLVRYCGNLSICERTCSVLRRGLVFFPPAALEPVVSPVLQRMSVSFEQTGFAAYLWISGKVVATIAPVGGEALHPLFAGVFEQETLKVSKLLEEQSAMGIPDVIEDYVYLVLAFFDHVPSILFSSPAFAVAFSHLIASLTVSSSQVTNSALDLLSSISKLAASPQYQHVATSVLAQFGSVLLPLTLQGVVQGFPEESLDYVTEILQATVAARGVETEPWIQSAVAGIPGHVVPNAEKTRFLEEVHAAIAAPGSADEQLKLSLHNVVRAARRARERGRQSQKSLGA